MSAHERGRESAVMTDLPLEKNAALGPYLLHSRLAIGGMSEVWLAQTSGGPTVALKALLPHLSEDADVVRMFRQEGVVGSELLHRNLVRVLEHGCHCGRYWIAMELVEGRTLRQIHNELRRKRRLPPVWFVAMTVSTICSALHWAQMRLCGDGRFSSLVHRDVSPDNVMVSFEGVPKLLDFGIARINGRDVQASGVGTLKGKAAYMAPEQIQDPSNVGPEADVYSVGVVLYELLTGHRPFEAPNEVALIHAILNARPKPPREMLPSLGHEVDALVMKALARSPHDRFSSADALKAALERLLAERRTQTSEKMMGSYVRGLFEAGAKDDAVNGPTDSGRKSSGTMRSVRLAEDSPPLTEWDQDILQALERTGGGEDHPWDRALRRSQTSIGRAAPIEPEPEQLREATPPPVAIVHPPPPAARQRTAGEWFELGLEHARRREDDQALAAWQEALRLQPDNRNYASNVRMLQRRMNGNGR